MLSGAGCCRGCIALRRARLHPQPCQLCALTVADELLCTPIASLVSSPSQRQGVGPATAARKMIFHEGEGAAGQRLCLLDLPASALVIIATCLAPRELAHVLCTSKELRTRMGGGSRHAWRTAVLRYATAHAAALRPALAACQVPPCSTPQLPHDNAIAEPWQQLYLDCGRALVPPWCVPGSALRRFAAEPTLTLTFWARLRPVPYAEGNGCTRRSAGGISASMPGGTCAVPPPHGCGLCSRQQAAAAACPSPCNGPAGCGTALQLLDFALCSERVAVAADASGRLHSWSGGRAADAGGGELRLTADFQRFKLSVFGMAAVAKSGYSEAPAPGMARALAGWTLVNTSASAPGRPFVGGCVVGRRCAAGGGAAGGGAKADRRKLHDQQQELVVGGALETPQATHSADVGLAFLTVGGGRRGEDCPGASGGLGGAAGALGSERGKGVAAGLLSRACAAARAARRGLVCPRARPRGQAGPAGPAVGAGQCLRVEFRHGPVVTFGDGLQVDLRAHKLQGSGA